MTGKTHALGGIAAGLAYAHMTGQPPVIMTGAAIVGGLLPDICHSGSKIGRKLPLISKLINLIFGHRTFTHSLLFLIIIAFIMNRFIQIEALTAGLIIGILSHYVLDMATRNGIKLFFPLGLTVKFPLTIRTGGLAENIIFSILAAASFYFGFQVLQFYI
ncbi:metal-dependent hydrolase [Salinicoccus albus]|uniref:metal-dependent hydrolase n=1 Tax=Salinicoccus albus TaxID=418756 RepID=UPI00036DAA4A|nr:metal-dependent hydrolase [Salinicoccus albus]